MPDTRFTNNTLARPQYLVQTHVRVKPYVAQAYTSQLSYKERLARQQARTAASCGTTGVGGSVYTGGGSGGAIGSTVLSANGNFFSPQLSTDFLELPQSLREKREWYRHFYNSDELVGQAIDLHTELPLSKVRLAPPKPRTCPEGFKDSHNYGKYILSRFQRMCDNIELFQRLITMVHHYWLDGNCLPADEWVTVAGGMKKAEDVEAGDLVLTHTGKWSPVSAVVQFDAQVLVGLNIARIPGSLRLTPEHPVEVLGQEGPTFVSAGKVQPGDFVRIPWPTEVVDREEVNLLENVPDYVREFENGYIVTRVQTRPRTKEAQRAREYLVSWLSGLEFPVMRSRKSIAEAAGVSVNTLHNVLLTLQKEVPTLFKVRVPRGKKKSAHTLWFPLEKSIQSDDYPIQREWCFLDAATCVPVNDDLLYVLGYWLGDGCLGRDANRNTAWGRGTWTICGGNPSLEYLSRVETALTHLLGKNSVVRFMNLIDGKPLYVLRVKGNPAFVEWWARNFGETSHGSNPKRVPSWVLDLPHEKQLSLLAGLIDSDGCVPRTHTGGVQINITSLNIVAAARDIMLRLGAIPSLHEGSQQSEIVEIHGLLCKRRYPSFTLSVHMEESARRILSKSCKRGRLNEAPRFFRSVHNYKVREDGVYFKVNSVKELPREPVFNFQVPGDETFRARFVSTHNCAVFAEDSTVEVPLDVGHTMQRSKKSVVNDDGSAVEQEEEIWAETSDREQRELAYYSKHYQGWSRLIILPIDQVKITSFSFTDKVKMELIPSDRDRKLVEQARIGDPIAEEIINEIPIEVRDHIEQSHLVPMGTDPNEGSFVFLLTGRKGADEELGHSILDRCHLPGTLVLVRRDGLVSQVCIEDLDPDRDQVLNREGRWSDFEHGFRSIEEDVAVVKVSKVQSFACTLDHKYPVLRDGQIIELPAGDLVPGDFLQVSQIPLTESLKVADFEALFDDTSDDYFAKKSGNRSGLSLSIVDRASDTFTVQYQREQTDPRKLNRFSNIRKILKWAASLERPVFERSASLCERFGLHPVTLKEIRHELSDFGYFPTVLKDKTIRFDKFDRPLPEQPPVCQTKQFPRTQLLDEDFGYFLGYWLGDGWVSRQPGLDYGVLGICWGDNEVRSRASLNEKVIPMLDSLGVSWSESKSGESVSAIFGYHDALVRWVAGNFGHNCEDKHLPFWIFDTPRSFLMGLLRGFVDSDGDVVVKPYGTVSVRMNSTNKTLAEQVFVLCVSLGLPVSMATPTKTRWIRNPQGGLSLASPCYAIHFSHGPSVGSFFDSGFLAKRRDAVLKDGRSGSRHCFHAGSLFYRVMKISRARHKGLVYSLNVPDGHNFFAGFLNTSNCLRTLLFRDKLRQAQTSIASRAMTPKRVVWAEGLSDADVDDLREQVDLALVDPDYSIVANYEIRWEEISARDRLLDLSTEYEQTERRLITGLGVTESLMSGESLYSGDRLKLEVINQRYLHLREVLQDYVEKKLFIPVARRMGFVEEDEWGQEVVLYPRLSFTRLPLRDSQDTFDALFNLYQKGSVSIDLILEMLNVDPDDTRSKIEADMFTVNDAVFNEVLRSVYSEVGRMLTEKTDIVERVAKYLQLKMNPPGEEGRF